MRQCSGMKIATIKPSCIWYAPSVHQRASLQPHTQNRSVRFSKGRTQKHGGKNSENSKSKNGCCGLCCCSCVLFQFSWRISRKFDEPLSSSGFAQNCFFIAGYCVPAIAFRIRLIVRISVLISMKYSSANICSAMACVMNYDLLPNSGRAPLVSSALNIKMSKQTRAQARVAGRVANKSPSINISNIQRQNRWTTELESIGTKTPIKAIYTDANNKMPYLNIYEFASSVVRLFHSVFGVSCVLSLLRLRWNTLVIV